MRPYTIVFTIVCALAVLAPTPAPAHAFTPLHMLGIRITDLRAGYTQVAGLFDGYQGLKIVAYRENVSTTQLHDEGWLNDYSATFHGPGTVWETLDQMKRPNGAHWFYTVDVGNTFCSTCYSRIPMATVGNESTAGLTSNIYRIIFRRGAYIVDVSVSGSNGRSSVLALARLIDQRIQQSG